MEQAIKIAIENGFVWNSKFPPNSFETKVAVLDPLFWQALGKGLGWVGVTYEGNKGYEDDGTFRPDTQEIWQYHWHRFIDHLAEGKDIGSFFTNLTS